MKHWYKKPGKLLKGYIRTILLIEGYSKQEKLALPIFTNGMSVLFCKTEKGHENYENVTQLSLFANSPADIWALNKDTTIVAYFFKPFAAAALFNIPATSLSQKAFPLSVWHPQKYTALKTQLVYSSQTIRKIEVLDNLLIQQLKENQQTCEIIQYATDKIMYNPTQEILSEILNVLNLNERTFQRIFKKYIGITPNQYRRICQFQQSFGQLRTKQFNKISEVAYDNGFADQSHFIRSFKEFTQITPNDYLKSGLKNKNT